MRKKKSLASGFLRRRPLVGDEKDIRSALVIVLFFDGVKYKDELK